VKDDPCFSCVLPECDDRDKRCLVRRLNNQYERKVARGEKHLITELEREANCRIFRSWYLERCAQAAEGTRPYKRWENETARGRKPDRASAEVGRPGGGAASGSERCAP
jgi:hypothetical protein